jgi:hypothetical protein
MNNLPNNSLSLFDNLDEKINLAIRKALEKHQKLGESVVVSQNGEIKTFTGEEIKTLLAKQKSDTDSVT